jgi:hypothetical protein
MPISPSFSIWCQRAREWLSAESLTVKKAFRNEGFFLQADHRRASVILAEEVDAETLANRDYVELLGLACWRKKITPPASINSRTLSKVETMPRTPPKMDGLLAAALSARAHFKPRIAFFTMSVMVK